MHDRFFIVIESVLKMFSAVSKKIFLSFRTTGRMNLRLMSMSSKIFHASPFVKQNFNLISRDILARGELFYELKCLLAELNSYLNFCF